MPMRIPHFDHAAYYRRDRDATDAAIRGVLLLGIRRGGLADGSIGVEVPDIADVSDADKAARVLNDVSFFGTLSGAIHTLSISGSVSA